MTRVLFLCTHNSCRSQLAEALTNHLWRDNLRAFSAGTEPTFVHPLALRALQEEGIDTSGLRSKGLEEFGGQEFDYAITLCANAEQSCPAFFGKTKREHLGFPDPSGAEGTEEERLAVFGRLLGEMKERLSAFFKQEGAL
jgi:arsenate reductase